MKKPITKSKVKKSKVPRKQNMITSYLSVENKKYVESETKKQGVSVSTFIENLLTAQRS